MRYTGHVTTQYQSNQYHADVSADFSYYDEEQGQELSVDNITVDEVRNDEGEILTDVCPELHSRFYFEADDPSMYDTAGQDSCGEPEYNHEDKMGD